MHALGEAKLLRIFIGEKDRCDGMPLYELIVREARKQGLAGATVLRGIEGFGASSHMHTARILRLSEDLPIVIEIADKEERIAPFVEQLPGIFDRAGCGGMATMEKVEVLLLRPTPGNREQMR
jgi:PII-like signaling protein